MQTVDELPFVAGNPALDFVNTAEGRGHPLAGDALTTPDDLRAWGLRYGILAAGATNQNPDLELSRAVQARELLYEIWSDRTRGTPSSSANLAQLAELASDAYHAARLTDSDDGRLHWRWDDDDLTTVRHVAVTSAVDLLTQTGTGRLKQCPGDHCGWFFLDTTKRGNRRWCSMSDCGQAAKTANRRKRPD